MKKVYIIIIAIFMATIGYSQVTEKEDALKKVIKDSTDGWEKGGVFTFTFGQSSFTNWSAGGINSISFNGLGSMYANYKKANLTWDNTLDLGLGYQRQGKGDDSQLLKTDDKFDFASKKETKCLIITNISSTKGIYLRHGDLNQVSSILSQKFK